MVQKYTGQDEFLEKLMLVSLQIDKNLTWIAQMRRAKGRAEFYDIIKYNYIDNAVDKSFHQCLIPC